MSKASDELERNVDGDVPTADEVVTATAKEAADSIRTQHAHLEASIRGDPLRAVAVAAGAGFVAALLLRRL